MADKSRIRKGDPVVVVTGRDRGKTGEVTKVLSKRNKVLVQGVSVVKRHTAPSASNPGGILEKEVPIDISNVSLVDPKDRKPTKIGYRFLEDGRKVRYAKRSGEVVDR
tara:strand:+ start:170 stop:493 length:324 start_codon:yes stop_codon:yes gene_type:complete